MENKITCLKIQSDKFLLSQFLSEHHEDLIVFVSGSWDYQTHTGSYNYTTCYEGKSVSRKMDLTHLKSSNVAMLLGLRDACEKIRFKNKSVFLVSPTELGFSKGQKGKGVNADLVKEILSICTQKNLVIHTLSLMNGGETLKKLSKAGNLNPTQKAPSIQTDATTYNKLVRDRIPEIIADSGRNCEYEVLSDKDYLHMVDAKLDEELAEYHKDKTIEELADLIEVIYAAAKARGYTLEQLEAVRADKAAKQGSFEKQILLKVVQEK